MTTTVLLTFDFDAVSIWIQNFKATSPTPISRGEYGASVGVPRILDVLRRHGVKATFFVPGHTADYYPRAVQAIRAAEHEIAAHGYLHESPVGMAPEEETSILERGEKALERICGSRPVGYRSPAWDLSEQTIELLGERGYLYDSSLMSNDFRLFHARARDYIAPDGEIRWGKKSKVIEFSVAWELDDFPYFFFLNRPPYAGPRNPEEVYQIWLAEFEYCRDQVNNGVFTLTMHPEIIGRGPRIAMLDRLIGAMKESGQVRFMTMGDAARDRQLQRVLHE